MKIFSEIIGNLFTDKTWADQLKKSEIEYLNLDWTIILISIFLSAADFVYFYALSYDDSMISIFRWSVGEV